MTSGSALDDEAPSTLNISFTYAGLAALGAARRAARLLPRRVPAGHGRAGRDRSVTPVAPTLHSGSRASVPATRTSSSRSTRRLRARARRARSPATRAWMRTASTWSPSSAAERLPDRKEHFGYADGVGQPALEGVGDPVFGEGDVGMFHHWHGAPGRRDLPRSRRRGRLPGPRARGSLRSRRHLQGVAQAPRGRRDVPHAGSPSRRRRSAWTRSCCGPSSSAGGPTAHRSRSPRIVPTRTWASIPTGSTCSTTATTPTGMRCPLGAHIRRTNPRCGLASGDALTARQRIVRRGMTYGPPLADGAARRRRRSRHLLRRVHGRHRAAVRVHPGELVQRRRRGACRPRPRPVHRARRRATTSSRSPATCRSSCTRSPSSSRRAAASTCGSRRSTALRRLATRRLVRVRPPTRRATRPAAAGAVLGTVLAPLGGCDRVHARQARRPSCRRRLRGDRRRRGRGLADLVGGHGARPTRRVPAVARLSRGLRHAACGGATCTGSRCASSMRTVPARRRTCSSRPRTGSRRAATPPSVTPRYEQVFSSMLRLRRAERGGGRARVAAPADARGRDRARVRRREVGVRASACRRRAARS